MSGTRDRTWILSLLVVLIASVGVGAASASCVEPGPLKGTLRQAPTVFVGTVTDLEHDARVATFQVEEIWTGTVEEYAVVNGGPPLSALEDAQEQNLGVATSVDRTYVLGERYLVVPGGRNGGVFVDSACSATQIFTGRLARHRPESAEILVAAGPPADTGTQPQPPQPPEVPGPVAAVREDSGQPEPSEGASWTLVMTVVLGASALVLVMIGHKRRQRGPSDDEV